MTPKPSAPIVMSSDRVTLRSENGSQVARVENGSQTVGEAHLATIEVLVEIKNERTAQNAKWGQQNHPDGTGIWDRDILGADIARTLCQQAAEQGRCTWRLILAEEVAEAFKESDPARLRAELVQVAAVATSWVEAIDRRDAS